MHVKLGIHHMIKKLISLIVLPTLCILAYTYSRNHGKWFLTEQTYCNQRKHHIAQEYWKKNVLNNTDCDHSWIKCIIQHPNKPNHQKNLQLLDTSLQEKDFDLFYSIINQFDALDISIIENEEKLSHPFSYGNAYSCKRNISINWSDIDALHDYINDSSFSGIISIQTPSYTYTLKSPAIADITIPFAIHSISKIFTELLLLIMIEENIIPKTALNEPLQINETAKKLLPTRVAEHLPKVTLQQTMEHRTGFGDYTFNYFTTLEQKVHNGESTALIENLEDFLSYAEDTIFSLHEEESHYSNVGIVLLGLVIEYFYNQKNSPEKYLSFEEILSKYIIQPAGMKIFSSQMPANGCYNESGSCAHYICASPAGGHWTTVQDLHAFALWLQKELDNPEFKELFSSLYFYTKETEEIHHCGGIGQQSIGESCARFALFLKQGVSIVIVSNRPQQAFTMYQTIYHNLCADQE